MEPSADVCRPDNLQSRCATANTCACTCCEVALLQLCIAWASQCCLKVLHWQTTGRSNQLEYSVHMHTSVRCCMTRAAARLRHTFRTTLPELECTLDAVPSAEASPGVKKSGTPSLSAPVSCPVLSQMLAAMFADGNVHIVVFSAFAENRAHMCRLRKGARLGTVTIATAHVSACK